MRFFPLLIAMPMLLSSCATPDPAKLENTIEVQDKKTWERVERAREREENWDRKWDAYSARQDAKYDDWLDRVFDRYPME